MTAATTLDEYLARLRELRALGLVHYVPEQRSWRALGHPEVQQVLADPAVFSSNLSELSRPAPEFTLFQRGDFVGMDDPEHRRLRGAVSQAFTTRAITDLEHRIGELATRLLDHAGDRFDLMDVLADPLPIMVIADILGVPPADHEMPRGWTRDLLSHDRDTDQQIADFVETARTTVGPVMRDMHDYFLELVRCRRTWAADDLISRLVEVMPDGSRLDDEEIVGLSGLLMLAGHVTATATLGNCVLVLHENPDSMTEIRADPTLLPAAIEEVLRLRTPLPTATRLTRVDVDIGDVRIPAGQVVLPMLTAANRDERVFAEPDRFDLHRKPNPLVTFGHGIHYCLGAPLARLEVRVALQLMFRRYRQIEVDGLDLVEQHNPWNIVGATRLPVAVRPA